MYLNIPDWYFLNGGNKTGMGYREVNWSLPRDYQEIIERQNIFDGTWEKTPSMGWMFVPLTEYQGGGAAATIEPLEGSPGPLRAAPGQPLRRGGHRLLSRACGSTTPTRPRAVVKRWTGLYNQHREVLNADILHLRRADGRDLDYLLHVNPAGREKGLLMAYNPLIREVKRTLSVPLYYTGLRGKATARERDGSPRTIKLDARATAQVQVTVPAKGVTWFVFE